MTPMRAQQPGHAVKPDSDEDDRWLVVAPGRIEPATGEIKVMSPVVGVIGEVLVKANEKVAAGDPLIRLTDEEARARVAAAEVQVALRRRVRNDEKPDAKAVARRRAEDAVADADKAVLDARSSLDAAVIAGRGGRGSEGDVEAARTALSRAQERLGQQKAELRKTEADAPLPTQAEGQLNISRSDLTVAEAALDKMTIRAPSDGIVLQLNAKVGELATPSEPRPLLVLGDLSALRVRAEVDERDIGDVKIGQAVMVRPVAFREREFAGKVSFIARLVEAAPGGSRGQRNMADVGVVEVLVDLPEPGPLSPGMKADVYFGRDSASRQ
jgi:HlyD family secretion protein